VAVNYFKGGVYVQLKNFLYRLIPVHLNLHPLFPHAYFCHKCNSLLLIPKNCPHKGCVIIKDILLLEVLFYCISCSEFLVLTYYIPRIIISDKNEANIM